MIIKIFSVLALALMASGCTIHHSIGDSFGSGVSQPKGQDFKPVGARWDFQNHALLYVYRPSSQWANDELEAPSFNVNEQRLFNIKGGAYTWYELKPGEYDVVMRRGLLGLEGFNDYVLNTVAQLSLEVRAGQAYYLRYSEIDPPEETTLTANELKIGNGPLQLVSTELALAELESTKMLHHGRRLLNPKEVAEDQELQRVFDGELDGAPQRADPTPALESEDRTKETWWPF